ncbi:MAG: Flp pilus assembly complex ATPase component TadA [Alphaproteobacteria bacterium]|nr:Flp pilus assembly complex ATPase component TadA [Alphaproteobacteria bacterium]MBR1756711.1 Flp pilus assembly complex ATPase component TadA [Alphaproteobacteria bacterium]
MATVNDTEFSDIYVIPDGTAYIWGRRTQSGLVQVEPDDYDEFLQALINTYDGHNPSYLVKFKGLHYRVERTVTLEGQQFCARKMPHTIPDMNKLGIESHLANYLKSLSNAPGLILLAGTTGSGKTTTIAALLREYLVRDGGYAFTLEDPVEMPLDGTYHTANGEIGICKQMTPPNGSWEEGLKSMLRSKPRYVYLGEIRDPEIASEALRAAISGHLVLSTIHASTVTDAIQSIVKYAAASGISEDMAYDLVGNGILGVLHQSLVGVPKRPKIEYVFANPDGTKGDQVRGIIKSGKMNLATTIESQRIRMERGISIFDN